MIGFSALTSGPAWTAIQDAKVSFSQATSSWGSVGNFALFDNATHSAGNLLYWGDLPGGSQEIPSGAVIEILAGVVKVRLD